MGKRNPHQGARSQKPHSGLVCYRANLALRKLFPLLIIRLKMYKNVFFEKNEKFPEKDVQERSQTCD
jgi:hypothetical protein